MRDPYEVLGVSKNAGDEEIKRAYRKLAHQYHPDKKHGDEAKFKEINAAYQILSDKKKRENFDRFGNSGFGAGQNVNWNDMGGFGGFQGINMDDLGDIFEGVFGGGFGGFNGFGGQERQRKGADVEIALELTLEEAYKGIDKEIRFETEIKCTTCHGKGGEQSHGFKTCTTCHGKGQIKEQQQTFFGQFTRTKICGICSGRGEIPNKPCDSCKGRGKKRGYKELKVRIPGGIQDGQAVHLKGEGTAGELGQEAGDLFARIRVRPHPHFTRKGDDLIIKKEVRLIDILKHKEIEIDLIRGVKKSITIPAGHDLKETIRISGEGMPKLGSFGHGSLLVELVVKAPKRPNHKTAKIIEELEKEID